MTNDGHLRKLNFHTSQSVLIIIIEELLIGFRELDGEHSGDNLAEVVWDTLTAFGLLEKVDVIKTDRVSRLICLVQ